MDPAFCRSKQSPTSHGSVAIVVCSTGAVVDVQAENDSKLSPIHGGAYRYVIDFNQAGKATNTESNFNGIGTTTAWRIVNLSGKNYLEMILGW
jgi:hypothetical protein